MTATATGSITRGLPNLTGLGWALIFAALCLALTGVFTSLDELLWVGVFLAALPIVAWAALWATTPRLNVSRKALPGRVPPNTAVNVTVDVPQRPTIQPYLCEEQLPKSLGRVQRFVVAGFRSSGKVRYEVRPQHRGVWPLGPLDIFVRDYFGLAQRRWREPASSNVIVFPEVYDVTFQNQNGAGQGSREMMLGGVANHGTPDNTVRAYRRGDDRRRVHWRSTARRGELMVRNQSKTTPLVAAIVLDIHTSVNATPEELTALERRISAAASAAICLARAGWQVDVVTGGPVLHTSTHTDQDLSDLLTGMARIVPGGPEALAAALHSAREVQSASLSLLFLSTPRKEDLPLLRSYVLHAAAGSAAIQTTPQNSTTGNTVPDTAEAQTALDLCDTLERSGWTMARTTPASSTVNILRDLNMVPQSEGTS